MKNERNNILILDNVPVNINVDDFANPLNQKLEDKSKDKEDNKKD